MIPRLSQAPTFCGDSAIERWRKIAIGAAERGSQRRVNSAQPSPGSRRPLRRSAYWLRWAVQYPEQRPPAARTLQLPRPELPVSFPVPDANLSWTVTDARTAPEPAT